MKKGMVVALAAGALMCSSLTFAAPVQLTSGQLDAVSAGNQSVDGFIDSLFNNNQQPNHGGWDPPVEESATATADAEESIAVDGTDQNVVGAEASQEGIATSGEDNVAVDVDGNIAALGGVAGDANAIDYTDQSDSGLAVAFGDDAELDLTLNLLAAEVEDGSAAVAGDHNNVTITTDKMEIEDAFIGGNGVIAKDATVTNSFNTEEFFTFVKVNIDDSFNVTTNTLDVSGQNGLTALVNALNLNNQFIGVNVSTTAASTTTPATDASIAGSGLNGNALAVSIVTQTVINGSIVIED